MSNAGTRNTDETASAWLERLRAIACLERLDASYRLAFDDVIRKAEQAVKQEQAETEADTILGPAKDAHLRLKPAQRERFRQWLRQIEQGA